MKSLVMTDGGRRATRPGRAGDCVVRAIAIATGKPYEDVRAAVWERAYTARMGVPVRYRPTDESIVRSNADPDHGVSRKVYEPFLLSLGWRWVPTMKVGTGCRVHLRAPELPRGRLVVRVSRHLVAVINGVVHDTYDPSRGGTRCVYGYYKEPAADTAVGAK